MILSAGRETSSDFDFPGPWGTTSTVQRGSAISRPHLPLVVNLLFFQPALIPGKRPPVGWAQQVPKVRVGTGPVNDQRHYRKLLVFKRLRCQLRLRKQGCEPRHTF